jgi:hypothetical protein
MTFTETNNSLEQMKAVLDIISGIQIKDTCTNKESAQEKLDFWKNTIQEELVEIRGKIKTYCKGIERTTDTRSNEDRSIFEAADTARTCFHNALITDLDIVVRDIKFNFSSKDFTPVIKARGLNVGAFLSGEEIEKIEFPREALFLPEGIFNGAPLLNASQLMLPGNRVKITHWAMSVYNSLSVLE